MGRVTALPLAPVEPGRPARDDQATVHITVVARRLRDDARQSFPQPVVGRRPDGPEMKEADGWKRS
jgi:hypothetical protein